LSVSAIVLAGGRSSRFGSAKLDVQLEGRSLLDHAIQAVASVASETIVVVAPDAPSPDLAPGVRMVRDPEAFGGPLVGLGAGLDAATTELAIVVGGDMPRLRPAVLASMLAALEAADGLAAVVLEDVDGPRPLPLALRVEDARLGVAATLAAGQGSLRAFVDELDAQVIAADVWRPLDPDGDTLVDVDRPEDLDRV
jgi:molybdenum cofactor guanylyltransferase